jgi:hypothetical protein
MVKIMVSPDDLQKLRDLLPDIQEAEQEIARAKRAGIDVTEAERKLNDAKRKRDGILREYGG